MTEHSADYDRTLCEYVGCSNPGWVVLHFGPKLTPPLRVACQTHKNGVTVDDLHLFPERVTASAETTEGSSDE